MGIPADVRHSFPARLPFYYGWVNVGMAVMACVATLPGRSWGLGLITEQLLADFRLDRMRYAEINLWATLIGAAFCVPAGWLIDRFGARSVFAATTAALGFVVLEMSRTNEPAELFWLITLTRGFGQSALSVVSLALVGKWFGRRLSLAMVGYMVGVLFGFAAAEWALGTAAETSGWRVAWQATGWFLLLGIVPLALFVARSTPEACGILPDLPPEATPPTDGLEFGLSLRQAVGTTAFWVFSLTIVLNSVTQAGISLFGVSLVTDRGLGTDAYKNMLVISTLGALVGTLIAWGETKLWPLKRMVAVGMMVLLGSLVYLPTVASRRELYGDGFIWGASIGLLGVAGSAIWRQAFGRPHLGAIQGAAGVCHVLASASGPLLMNVCREQTGTYGLFFYVAGAGLALGAVAAWFVRLPSEERAG